jgi:zinc protease
VSEREPKPTTGLDWSKLPGPSPVRPFRAPKFVRRTLSNGIDTWIAPWKTLPLVSVRLVIPAGTADDPREKSGLATLTAALLDKGTTGRTATELAESLEVLGVTLGARASADNIAIGFSTVVRNLEPVLKLVDEVLTSPRFDPKDFDRERRLQLAGLIQGPDSVNWIAGRAFPVLVYGAGHPYGNPAPGYRESVEGLTLDDVRRFHATHLGPKGATLIVVGDVEPDALIATLESTLGGWKPRGEGAEPRPSPEARAGVEPGAIAFVDKPGAVQSVVTIGRPWAERSDPRYYAARLGNRILGADFLSRLNQNLREKNGFTYGAGSSFRFRRSGSLWTVSTQVRTDATAPALKEALGELDALAGGGGRPFTPEEITTALEADTRSFPSTFESPGSIAGILAEMAEFRLPPDYLDTILDRLHATRPEEIARTMAEVVAPGERVVLIVGDRKAVEPKLRELGFTRIRFVTPDGIPAGG